jgi:hypothetical protein
MTNKLFLPNRYKKIGWFLLVPAAIAGIFLTITGYEADWLTTKVFAFFSEGVFADGENFTVIKTNVTNTLVGVIFIIGAMMVGLSKEQHEDEFISDLRLSSLLWALWVNYVLLLLAFIFVYGLSFFNVMVYNMFTILIIFIIRFNYLLYKSSKTVSDEK